MGICLQRGTMLANHRKKASDTSLRCIRRLYNINIPPFYSSYIASISEA